MPYASPVVLPADHKGQGASPLLSVRNSRPASAPGGLPGAPLLTGLPPRFIRHRRRSAPPLRSQLSLVGRFMFWIRGALSQKAPLRKGGG